MKAGHPGELRQAAMISGVRIVALQLALAVAATIAATPAAAVTRDQIKQCDGAGDATAEQRIAACDAIIAGSHNAKQRATAQRNKAKFAKTKNVQQQKKAAGLLEMNLPPGFTVPDPLGLRAGEEEDPLDLDDGETPEFAQDFLGEPEKSDGAA